MNSTKKYFEDIIKNIEKILVKHFGFIKKKNKHKDSFFYLESDFSSPYFFNFKKKHGKNPYYLNLEHKPNIYIFELDLTRITKNNQGLYSLHFGKHKKDENIDFLNRYPLELKKTKDDYKNLIKKNRQNFRPKSYVENNIYFFKENLEKDLFFKELSQFLVSLFSFYADQELFKNEPDFFNGESEGNEQKKKSKTHKRSSALVKSKKIEKNYTCEACNYYQEINGKHIIECHHNISIAEGERITKLDDLTLLCPNCHRIAHSTYGEIKDLVEIKKIVTENNKVFPITE